MSAKFIKEKIENPVESIVFGEELPEDSDLFKSIGIIIVRIFRNL